MENEGTWIDWQYLLNAAALLKKVCACKLKWKCTHFMKLKFVHTHLLVHLLSSLIQAFYIALVLTHHFACFKISTILINISF